MLKGFIGIPFIFVMIIVFCSSGAAYLVANDLTDTTIVAPISDFGHFGDGGGDVLGTGVVSPVPVVSVNENSYDDDPSQQYSSGSANPDLVSAEEKVEGLVSAQTGSLEVKLDSVDPTSGNAEDLITLKGSGFGSLAGSIYFRSNIDDPCCATQADFWSDTEIKVAVVASGIRVKISIAVETAEGKISNYLDFEVLSGLPLIENIEPGETPPGQFTAIYGKEFGDDLGHVNFYESSGAFVGECVFGAGYVWNNSQISCIVPEELWAGDYNIEVVTSDLRESDIKQISLN